MIDRISHFIIRQKLLIILISFTLVILAASGLPKTKFSSDYRIFFSEDNENLKAFEDLQATFTKSDNVMFVLAPKNGQVLKRLFMGLTLINYRFYPLSSGMLISKISAL